jgi:hypothetical protein
MPRANNNPGEEMSIQIRNPRDFCAGLLFLFFGAVATWFARDYPMGSALRMGPGYFPMVLGVLLLLLGAATCAAGLALRGEAVERMRARPLVLILAAVGAFALAIEPAGIIVATVLATVLATAASAESRVREVAVLVVVLLALAVGVFTYGLGLPFRLVPGG